MFTDAFLFKLDKCGKWYNFIIVSLVCILITIAYLHGKAYTHCNSFYPDEIMDLQCSILLSRSKIEENIRSKTRDNNKFFSFFYVQVFYIYSACIANDSFFIEYSHLEDFKKRLFMLQHYNS